MNLVHVGSGKKYKKCCINKEESFVVTPADAYIEKSLENYPKEELQKFFDNEIVCIDEKLYKALKTKNIPLLIDRNYAEEVRHDLKNMEDATKLILKKCRKEKITTQEEYDNKIAIHYSFKDVMYGYMNILNNDANPERSKCQEKQIEFLLQISKIFNLEESLKKVYINNIINSYLEYNKCSKAKKALEKLKVEFPEMEKYINKMFARIYFETGEDMEKTLGPIEENIKKFGLDEKLQKEKIEIYYEYASSKYYEDEEKEIQIYQQLWNLVKEFIKTQNIKTEEEYDDKVSNSCCYYNIIKEIDDFYYYCEDKDRYTQEKLQFFNEAINLIKLDKNSKDILIRSLSVIYCEQGNEAKSVELMDNYIKEYPNNSYAYLIKSNIYSDKENPENDKAISILQEALKNDKIVEKYSLFVKLALLYDECGNEKEALKYQKLARKSEPEIY